MPKRNKQSEAERLVAALRANTEKMYAGLPFEAFTLKQRALWDEIRASGVEELVLKLLRETKPEASEAPPDPLYTTHEIAQIIQVDASTVSKWIDKALLTAFRTPGGHRRVRRADLVAFLRKYKMPVPKALEVGRHV